VAPLIGHATLAAGDLSAAKAWRDTMDATMYRGEALGRDLQGLAAGIDALGGNRSVALAQFREALTGYRVLGLAFDEALTVLDMVSLLGADEPEVLTAAEWARGTLTHLGAKPLVDRLDTAMSQPSRAPAGAAMEIGSGARSTSVTATTG